MRFNSILILIIASTLLTGCINQNPAPIEYSSSLVPTNTVPNYYGVPQNTKTQEESITSQELIINEPQGKAHEKKNSQDKVSYEDKIKKFNSFDAFYYNRSMKCSYFNSSHLFFDYL